MYEAAKSGLERFQQKIPSQGNNQLVGMVGEVAILLGRIVVSLPLTYWMQPDKMWRKTFSFMPMDMN